jgi:peptidoglycan-associated lipoprotein
MQEYYMLHKAWKSGLGLACVMAVLAGCSSTGDKDGAGSGMDSSANGAGSGSMSGSDMAANLDTVFYFDFDKAVLRPESRAALTAHAEILKATPRQVRLEGHADERGTREYNMALGERRAYAVKDFLVLQGVNEGMLEVISYGEERPLAQGSDESSYQQNRRVELK